MNLQAEQLQLISQVLTIRDAELLLRVRQFMDKQLAEEPATASLTEAEWLARLDASEAAYERGDVLSHEEVTAHFRRPSTR